jgi:hypothetical protein
MDEASRRRRRDMPEPPQQWADLVVRAARRNDLLLLFARLYDRAVPLLFALFVAAPIGLLILPFFVPKFIRNSQRRRRYRVRLSKDSVDRLPGRRRSTDL